jgi:hypothetical protein
MAEKPKGLPTATADATSRPRERSVAPMSQRVCEKCGNDNTRVVSNHLGVSIHCTCGHKWARSATAVAPPLPNVPARGFQKVTLVEPDWNKAYEPIGEGEDNEQVGPKK